MNTIKQAAQDQVDQLRTKADAENNNRIRRKKPAGCVYYRGIYIYARINFTIHFIRPVKSKRSA